MTESSRAFKYDLSSKISSWNLVAGHIEDGAVPMGNESYIFCVQISDYLQCIQPILLLISEMKYMKLGELLWFISI